MPAQLRLVHRDSCVERAPQVTHYRRRGLVDGAIVAPLFHGGPSVGCRPLLAPARHLHGPDGAPAAPTPGKSVKVLTVVQISGLWHNVGVDDRGPECG